MKKNYKIHICVLLWILLAFSCTESEKQENEYSEVTHTEENRPSHSAGLLPTENANTKAISPLANNNTPISKRIAVRDVFINHMPFTANKGQLEKHYNIKIDKIGDIKFYSQAFGGTAYFGEKGIGIGFHTKRLEEVYTNSAPDEHDRNRGNTLFFYIDHEGSNKETLIEGVDEKSGKLNYLKGNEEDFITNIGNYGGVVYKELYNAIDLKYYMHEKSLVYDYIVKPGGNVSDIKRTFSGIKNIKINSNGELELYTDWGILKDKKIYAYQIINGKEKEVNVTYKKLSNQSVGFEVIGNYDPEKNLVIDPPTLTYSTWVNPGGTDGYIYDITTDASGNIYACGWSNGSQNFTLVTPFDNVPAGGDALVFKLSSDGTTLIYASFIGGDGNGGTNETGHSIAVNSSNQAYVVGMTDVATGFPTAGTPLQGTIAGNKDIFVVKLNAAGTGLIYSTFYGGTGDDRAFGVDVNSSDEVFITGWTGSTSGFSSAGAFQTAHGGGTYDAFILKISDPTPGVVVRNYCTYVGGPSNDVAQDIAVNGNNAYITGTTQSTSGIRTVGATFGGGGGGGAYDAFITCINGATGNNRVYGTYVGGDFDERSERIALNPTNNHAYITGWTSSIVRGIPGTFPVVNAIAGHAQNANPTGGNRDAFMTHVDATGVIQNSTFMGVELSDNLRNSNPFDGLVQYQSGGIAVTNAGNVAVAISTDGSGSGLPLVSAIDGSPNGGAVGLADAYLFVTDTDAQTLIFSTYFGGDGNDYPTAGVQFDPSGCIILAGSGHSTSGSFPANGFGGSVYANTRVAEGPDENYVTKYCDVVTPVQWLSFTAKAQTNNTVLLNWSTASEENNDYFEVLRSKDGINFEVIGIVDGSGNSVSVQSYSYIDENPYGGLSYYKLRQVDYDGAWEYSKTASVLFDSQNLQVIQDGGQYYITGAAGEMDVSVILFTVNGQQVTEQTLTLNAADRSAIHINDLSSGVYIAKIITSSESISKKLLIQ